MAFKPLTVADIKAKMDKPYEVELSGFDTEDQNDTFPCILRNVPLTEWMFHGKVPNELAETVEKLFEARLKGDVKKVSDMTGTLEGLKGYNETLEWIARESLVKPSYDDLAEAGLYLTQVQLNEIYMFQTQGAAALKTFRKLLGDAAAGADGGAVEQDAVGNTGD